MANDTRSRMLDTTARLLQHRGYYGTALRDVLRESGAPRGSLYFHFPGGKDQLAIEATRAAVDEATRSLRAALAEAASPAEGVRRYFELAADLLEESDYTFGCPVAPVILDAAGGVAELEALCRATFETWTGLLAEAFEEAGIAAPRARSLALLAVTSLEGVLLVVRAYRDTAPLLAVATELEGIVTAASDTGPPMGPARPTG